MPEMRIFHEITHNSLTLTHNALTQMHREITTTMQKRLNTTPTQL